MKYIGGLLSFLLFLGFFVFLFFLIKWIKGWNEKLLKLVVEKGIDTEAELRVEKRYKISQERWKYDVYATYEDETGSLCEATVMTSITAKNNLSSPGEEPGIFLSVTPVEGINSGDTMDVSFHDHKVGKSIKYPGHPIMVKIRYYPDKIAVPATKREEYFAVLLSKLE